MVRVPMVAVDPAVVNRELLTPVTASEKVQLKRTGLRWANAG